MSLHGRRTDLPTSAPHHTNGDTVPELADVGAVLARHASVLDASSLSSIDRPPSALSRTFSGPHGAVPRASDPDSHTLGDVGGVLARHDSVPEASSLASIDRPPSVDEKLPASKIYGPLSFPVLALLAPASILGVLARLGLQAVTKYDGSSVFPLAYAQTIGCFIMGFLLEQKEPIGQYYGPMYTALTTGFCGSLTTFSGWQLDVYSSWDNAGQFRRDWFRDVIDGLTKTAITLGMSLGAVSFGAHLSSKVSLRHPIAPPSKPVRYTLSLIAVLFYAATLPAYFRLPAAYRHQATAALLFSYPGTLTRYLLSIYLNPRWKALPLGTFTANMIGTALLGTFHVLQSAPAPVSTTACYILQGLSDGYCGCLTTVSTFAAEVMALEEKKRWRYIVLSWVVAQLLLVTILEPSFNAGRVSEQITCSFT